MDLRVTVPKVLGIRAGDSTLVGDVPRDRWYSGEPAETCSPRTSDHPGTIDGTPVAKGPSPRRTLYLHRRFGPEINQALCPLAPGVYLVVVGARGESPTFS